MIPLLSIVLLTYNTCELTLKCLGKFSAGISTVGGQIIVVDNGSTDGTVDAIRQQYKDIEVVRSERNLGYAGGNNLGLQRATGRSVILLNSDVFASAETLNSLAEEMLRSSQIGALSPRLLTPELKPQAFAFGGDPTIAYLLARGMRQVLHLGPMHQWDIDQPIEVDWVSGACMCVRAEAIQKAGPLDTRFFLYFEDNDWCLRIRRAGWKVVFDPRYQVIHLGGASQPTHRVSNNTYYASMLAFHKKHYSPMSTLMLRGLIPLYKLSL
jgi:GT2 family glycosyltransferase